MRPLPKRTCGLALGLALGSICLQAGGCSLTGLRTLLTTLNPCGTVLNCDPRAFRFIMSGIDEPGVRPEIDPFCTWPPLCANDPIFGGAGGLP